MSAIQWIVVHSKESDMFGSRTRFGAAEGLVRILPGFADRRFLTAAAAAACSTPVSVCLLCLVCLCVCVFAGVF